MENYNLLQSDWTEFTSSTYETRNRFEQNFNLSNVVYQSNDSLIAAKGSYFHFSKAVFDFFFALLTTILVSPLLLLASLLILIIDRQWPLFSQERVGLNNKSFVIYKFRTMKKVDSKSPFAKLLQELEADGIVYKDQKDPRITKLGKFLRKTSIDELPQLFNVLKGEMSLIGPRPLVPILLKDFPEIIEARSLVKPGITGLWQVMARAQNQSVFSMIKWDFDYIQHFSFKQDLFIFFKTFWVVIKQDGAV
jgi:lipopolysaccharide/colanic/teichoic acid biosynthesis glycosyltransferase